MFLLIVISHSIFSLSTSVCGDACVWYDDGGDVFFTSWFLVLFFLCPIYWCLLQLPPARELKKLVPLSFCWRRSREGLTPRVLLPHDDCNIESGACLYFLPIWASFAHVINTWEIPVYSKSSFCLSSNLRTQTYTPFHCLVVLIIIIVIHPNAHLVINFSFWPVESGR